MDWKAFGKKLLFPPVGVLAILSVLSAVLLTLVFVKGWEQSPMAYGSYVLAFYTLTAVCLYCALVLPGQYGKIKKRLHEMPITNRYLTDREFRTRVSVYVSLGVNLLYVVLQLVFWYTNRSWWFVVLAVYYGILATMRLLLAGAMGTKSIPWQWKRARSCAWILLLVNLSLSGAVLMILYQSKGFDYPGILIYVMAVYSFYSLIHSVVDMIRYRKLGSPILSATKTVSLSAALVSLLNLETAMFVQFGQDMTPEEQRLFIILTGAGVSITVITLSVLLMVKATKELKKDGE